MFTKAAGRRLFVFTEVERYRLVALIDDYARTGAGPIMSLRGSPYRHLRFGGYRVTFEEDSSRVLVTDIAPVRTDWE